MSIRIHLMHVLVGPWEIGVKKDRSMVRIELVSL